LWSSKTQASKKVVGCSISVTEWSEARRARKDISVLPGYDVTTLCGVFAPRDTPAAIIAELNATINESLKEEAFGQHMAREFGRWNAVREAAGIPQQ
jgi:Tripartite tricarboxylate transporter family receptor